LIKQTKLKLANLFEEFVCEFRIPEIFLDPLCDCYIFAALSRHFKDFLHSYVLLLVNALLDAVDLGV
jgi:hypothetical protein